MCIAEFNILRFLWLYLNSPSSIQFWHSSFYIYFFFCFLLSFLFLLSYIFLFLVFFFLPSSDSKLLLRFLIFFFFKGNNSIHIFYILNSLTFMSLRNWRVLRNSGLSLGIFGFYNFHFRKYPIDCVEYGFPSSNIFTI